MERIRTNPKKVLRTEMILKCYWTEEGKRMTKQYASKEINTLISQATLERLAHNDWVGFRIEDPDGAIVFERWSGKQNWVEGSWLNK